MGTTVSTVNGYPGVDGLEANNIPTHVAALIAKLDSGSNLSRLTQAQIDALTGAQKPNGLTVFNTTRGVLQVSNGVSFADVLTARGATVSGDIDMEAGEGSRLIRWLRNGVVRWRTGFTAPYDAWSVQRYNASGVYVDEPLLVRTDGLVVSNSHVGGVTTVTTNASGIATLALPTSPTGNWAVIPFAPGDMHCALLSATASSAQVRVRTIPGMALYAGMVSIFWHAVAY